MYTMGTLLRHGGDRAEGALSAADRRGELRLQAFGVTEPTRGSDTTHIAHDRRRDGDVYVVQRPEDLDLARASTPT